MVVKHTLSNEHLTYNDLMLDIMNMNLDIRVEHDPSGWLLIGDQDHLKYLLEECYGISED